MNWEDKVKLLTHLNCEEYSEAVEMLKNEEDWDPQMVSMFINGFSLTEDIIKLCNPIKERLLSLNPAKMDLGFRECVRIGMLQHKICEKS